MEDTPMEPNQETPRRRRRKRTKWELFKENWLPYLIMAAAALLIVIFIAGGVSRAVRANRAEKDKQLQESQQAAQQQDAAKKQVEDLIARADKLAEAYDFDGAIALLDSFTGDTALFPELLTTRSNYMKAKMELTEWSDPSQVPHLSFQLLIADPARAFADETYGKAYNRNYVTTDEFSKILDQLYANGYMLVRLSDIVTTTVAEDGSKSFSANTLYLPKDKKPLVLSQCAVNYFTYMVDGDDDGLPDKDGDGFAYLLDVDENGKFYNKMVDAAGNEVTGAFDFVPILENFIEAHPDFSYRGARAVLTVTGYDGVFGYRTTSKAKEARGKAYYDEQVAGAQKIVSALRDTGYELGCYSYLLFGYAGEESSRISQDLNAWKKEVTPVLGDVEIFIYPFGSDIADYRPSYYSGDRYEVMKEAGFRYFIGMDNTQNWADVTPEYFRQTRRWVTGSYMAHSPEMFSGLFEASAVLNGQRGTVPTN